MNSPNLTTDSPAARQDEIARKAQSLGEEYGRPSGRDLDIWLTAELLTAARAAEHENVASTQWDDDDVHEPFARALSSPPPTPPALETQTGHGRMPARHRR